jgi:ribosome-binding factor A
VEKRGAQHHRGRLSEELRKEIETLVEGELADPRIGLVSVSGVELAADGRSAHVLVEVDGTDEEAERSLEGLDAAKPYIRHELVERLQLRRPPELFFRLSNPRHQRRVEELLQRTKKRSASTRTESGAPGDSKGDSKKETKKDTKAE